MTCARPSPRTPLSLSSRSTTTNSASRSSANLTQAKLTAAQLRLASLRAADETALDREHLARLIGLPPTALSVDSSFPASPVPLDATVDTTVHGYANAAVASAFDNAKAKQQQAWGDARFRFRPQVNLFAQYNYYATFSDSFAQLQKVYQANTGQTTLSSSEGAFGIQITLPIMDRTRAAKARESAADATPSPSSSRRPRSPGCNSSLLSNSSTSCNSSSSRATPAARR